MSSADRDARIAAIEGRVTAWCVASGVNHAEFMRNLAMTVLDEFPTGSTAGDRMNKIGVLAGIDAPWLIAELRAALSREEEAKKDAERMRTMRDDAINIARRMGAAGGVCPTHGISVLVTHTTDGHPCTDYLLAPARSVSLSENG